MVRDGSPRARVEPIGELGALDDVNAELDELDEEVPAAHRGP